MEKTSSPKASKKSASIGPEEHIEGAYIGHLLNNGQRPPSVFKFSRELGIKEDDFYKLFGSFDGVERSIWKRFFNETIMRLESDNTFSGFSVREKILAFYYTFFEDLRSKRSFVLLQLDNHPKLDLMPEFLKDFRAAYENWIGALMAQGKETGEIANRPYLEKTYPKMFWLQMGFLLVFWKKDNSPAFEQTDAAVEKSVNLSFDLIEKGAVDTAFDFAKFMVQTRTK